MQNENQLPECAYQYFFTDELDRAHLFEMITLAYVYSENFGPVVMICTEKGNNFLIDHMLDEIYIDVVICETEDMARAVVHNLVEHGGVSPDLFINSLKDCPENLRILYGNSNVDAQVLQKIRVAIDKEETKSRI